MTHVDVREFLDVVSAVLLCLLAEGDEELHLVPRVQVSNVAPIGQRVHVEEDIFTGLVLTLVGNETILGRRVSGGGGKEWKGREPNERRRKEGEKGGRGKEGGRRGRGGRRGKIYISGKKETGVE